MAMRDRLIALGIISAAFGIPGGRGPGGGQPPGGSGGGGSGEPPGYQGPPPPPPPPGIGRGRVPFGNGNRPFNDGRVPFNRPEPPPPPPGPVAHPINPKPPTRPQTRKRAIVADAPGAVVPVIYGQKPTTTLFPYRAVDTSGRFLFGVWVVAVGPVNNIYDIKFDGHTFQELGLTLGSTINVYTGTKAQGVDPIIFSNDNSWTSGFPGIAYITAKLDGQHPVASKIDPKNVVCTVEGLLVRDPRLNPNSAAAPTAAAGAGGALTGFYDWAVTFVDGSGNESPGTAASNALTLSAKQASLTAVPVGPGGTASRNVYRRIKTDPNPAFRLTGAVAGNVTTTFTDTTADGSLGAEIPYTSTQRVYSTTNALCHADFRTSRRYGFNDADANQDWASISAAANDCEFLIATPSSGPASPPSIVYGAAYSGGLSNAQLYSWVYTFVVNGVETGSSTGNTPSTPANNIAKATLTILTGPAGTTSRRIYRNKGYSASQTPRYLVGEIFDNTTTSFADTLNDYQLSQTTAPPSNPTLPRYQMSAWLAERMQLQDFDQRFRASYSAYLTYDTAWHYYVDLARSASAIAFDTTNIIGELDIQTMGLSSKFSRVVIQFDDAQNGFKQATAVIEHPNYAAPPTELDREERREAAYQLDVPTYDQARRLAVQIFNRARLSKQVSWNTFARGIRAMPGIVVTLTHPTGPLSATPVIVTDVALSEDGTSYKFTGEFYDASVYLDTPQYTGNPLIPPVPSPFAAPDPPTGCAVSEVDEYGADGQWHARLRIDWTPTPTPFYLGTLIQFSSDGGVTWFDTGLHSVGPYYIEGATVGVLYAIRLFTVLTTLIQSDSVTLTYTPTLTGTIQEVLQGAISPSAQYGARLEFYGPIPSVMLAARNKAPAVAPNLSLSAGGIVPTGVYQVWYSRVTAQTETHLSPAGTITVTPGNQILNFSNVLDVDGIGGGAGVLFKKVYISTPGGSTPYFRTTMNTGVTSGSLNTAALSTPNAELVNPNTFDGVDHWNVYDISDPANPIIFGPPIDVLSPPQAQARYAIGAAVYPDPSTGVPRVDIKVTTVDKLGNESVGKSYSLTSGIGYPAGSNSQVLAAGTLQAQYPRVDFTGACTVTPDAANKKLIVNVGSAAVALGQYAPGSFTIPTGQYAIISKRLQMTGSQRMTGQGTSRLRGT